MLPRQLSVALIDVTAVFVFNSTISPCTNKHKTYSQQKVIIIIKIKDFKATIKLRVNIKDFFCQLNVRQYPQTALQQGQKEKLWPPTG